MAAQLGADRSGVHGKGTHTAIGETVIELDCEQDVGGLRPPVAEPRLVRRAFEVGVVEVHVAEPVPSRAERHDAGRRGGDERGCEQVREQEVPEVVGAELQLEAVGGGAEGASHDTGVVDEHVETVMVGEEAGGACPNTRQRGELELAHLEVGSRHRRADALHRRPTAIEVAHRHGDGRAVGGDGPRGLLAQAGRRTGDEDPPAPQVDTLEHIVGRAVRSEARHRGSLPRGRRMSRASWCADPPQRWLGGPRTAPVSAG